MSDASAVSSSDYPARLDVEYPEGGLSRASTFFRAILAIPIVVVSSFVAGTIASSWPSPVTNVAAALTAGGLFGPTLLMLLFRRKYPR